MSSAGSEWGSMSGKEPPGSMKGQGCFDLLPDPDLRSIGKECCRLCETKPDFRDTKIHALSIMSVSQFLKCRCQ